MAFSFIMVYAGITSYTAIIVKATRYTDQIQSDLSITKVLITNNSTIVQLEGTNITQSDLKKLRSSTIEYGSSCVNLDRVDIGGIKSVITLTYDIALPEGKKSINIVSKRLAQGYRVVYYFSINIIQPGTKNEKNERIIKEEILQSNDNLTGIYQIEGVKYALTLQNNKYYAWYLSGHNKFCDEEWEYGDLKAILLKSSVDGILVPEKWFQECEHKELINSSNPGYGNFKLLIKGGIVSLSYEALYGYPVREWHSREVAGVKLFPTDEDLRNNPHEASQNINNWSGTGFALCDGYLVTNFHVVVDAKDILVYGVNGNFSEGYRAVVIGVDKSNDLALMKINDANFNGFGTPPYAVRFAVADVGEDVSVLGYPLTATMGEEVKLTNGIISSKTGFEGNVSLYQISAPIQPGNSGGPLFDKRGNIIGIVCAQHIGAENASYAIKTSYLKNLVESISSSSIIPNKNTISSLPLTDQVKRVNKFVFLIKCSK